MSKEIEELKDQINDAVSDIRRGFSDMEDAFERYQRLLGQTPCDALNELIKFGFVPGAVLKFDGKPYTFKGYTEGLGLQFVDSEGNSINGADVETNYQHLDRWSK
jgi:hypothetical protein